MLEAEGARSMLEKEKIALSTGGGAGGGGGGGKRIIQIEAEKGFMPMRGIVTIAA